MWNFSNRVKEAEVSSPEDQFNLGEKYYYKNNDDDYKKAVEWYVKAANQGFSEAQCALGYMYSQGKGVEQNSKRAAELYSKAANQGLAKAQYNLATLYLDGRGVPKDTKKAKELYTLAANNGDSDAQKYLEDLPEDNAYSSQNIAKNNMTFTYEKAQSSKHLFDKALEYKRNEQYQAALKTYKQAYEAYPDDPDVQSTMYAMAKIYLLIGDYEKACALFQDGLTMKLAQNRDRTGKFYQKYVMTKFTGGLSESDPEYVWFRNLTADYSIFIGLSHYLLENDGAELLSQYRNDFNNHMQSVAGKPAARPSAEYLQTCYEYGWVRVILIASEFKDSSLSGIYIDHVQERKQEFLDILKTIG